jgi:hypothetical protein
MTSLLSERSQGELSEDISLYIHLALRSKGGQAKNWTIRFRRVFGKVEAPASAFNGPGNGDRERGGVSPILQQQGFWE